MIDGRIKESRLVCWSGACGGIGDCGLGGAGGFEGWRLRRESRVKPGNCCSFCAEVYCFFAALIL